MKEYTGFIPPKEITPDHHVFGAIGIALPIIKVDGDWRKHRSSFESQLEQNFDPDDCTVAGTFRALQALENYTYGTVSNYSERFTYNTAEMKPPGDDPHRIITVVRGSGIVMEEDLPTRVDSLAEFMTPRPVPVDLRIKGQKYLNKQMVGHQWLWDKKPDQKTRIALLKEGLTKGVVCCSVSAWWKNDKGLYYSPTGTINGHWGHVENIDDEGIHFDDTYNDAETNTNLKVLTLDHDIEFAKVYYFTVPDKQQYSLMGWIISLLQYVGWVEKSVAVPIVPVTPVVENHYQEVKEAIKINMIEKWAKIIAKNEGANPSLNNPANFKYAPLIASWGAIKGPKGSDGGYFAKFTTYDMGFQALCNFLTLGCKNELKDYHNARTIKEFTLVYTNHPKPAFDYSDSLIKELGVTANTLISTFLS